MTERDSAFAERFARMADDGQDADWLGVRRRASLAAKGRRPRKPAAVAAALAAAIAVPALAIAGAATGLIPGFRGEPAPPAVQESFARFSASDLPHAAVDRGVRASEAKGVLEVRSAIGTVRIWVAPTESGERCRLLQVGDAKLAFSCGSPVLVAPFWAGVDDLDNGIVVVDGRAGPAVSSVSIRLEDGTKQRLALVDGYFAGLATSANRPVSITVDRGELGTSTFSVPADGAAG